MSAGQVIRSFSSPDLSPFGLTWDGRSLWHSDIGTSTIYQINPASGQIIQSFSSPGTGAHDLTWVKQSLWHADANNDTIYQLSIS